MNDKDNKRGFSGRVLVADSRPIMTVALSKPIWACWPKCSAVKLRTPSTQGGYQNGTADDWARHDWTSVIMMATQAHRQSSGGFSRYWIDSWE